MDLRGHGDAQWASDGDYTTDAMVEDLDAVCAELGRPPVVVGASMGGMVGLVREGSLRPGRFQGLVLVDIATQLERSEEHTYELQSLMRISYAVFCLKKKNKQNYTAASS